MNTKQIRVLKETHTFLKKKAAEQQTTMLQIIENLIKEEHEID